MVNGNCPLELNITDEILRRGHPVAQKNPGVSIRSKMRDDQDLDGALNERPGKVTR